VPGVIPRLIPYTITFGCWDFIFIHYVSTDLYKNPSSASMMVYLFSNQNSYLRHFTHSKNKHILTFKISSKPLPNQKQKSDMDTSPLLPKQDEKSSMPPGPIPKQKPQSFKSSSSSTKSTPSTKSALGAFFKDITHLTHWECCSVSNCFLL
jgi:hypothetical protein